MCKSLYMRQHIVLYCTFTKLQLILDSSLAHSTLSGNSNQEHLREFEFHGNRLCYLLQNAPQRLLSGGAKDKTKRGKNDC